MSQDVNERAEYKELISIAKRNISPKSGIPTPITGRSKTELELILSKGIFFVDPGEHVSCIPCYQVLLYLFCFIINFIFDLDFTNLSIVLCIMFNKLSSFIYLSKCLLHRGLYEIRMVNIVN